MDPAGLRALTFRCSPVAAHFLPRLSVPPVLLPELRSRSRLWLSRNPNEASPRLLSSASCSLEKSDVDTLSNGIARAGSEVSCDKLLQVVLVSPQIPGNTGCIARTCAASAIGLHLVEPLGYTIDDAKLKRAGLDYWPYVVVKIHSSWSEFRDYFMRQNGDKRLLAFTKRGTSIHSVTLQGAEAIPKQSTIRRVRVRVRAILKLRSTSGARSPSFEASSSGSNPPSRSFVS